MGMDRDGRARGEPGTVDRAFGHRLSEWQQFDAWQKIDRYPFVGVGVGEGLLPGHGTAPALFGNPGFIFIVN
jgi:hypothetical protein